MTDGMPRGAEIGLLDLVLARADDVLATAAFYRDVLGAVVQTLSPEWAQLRLANVDIGIHARGASDERWEPGFRVASIAALKAHLEGHGVSIAEDYHDIPGGVKLAFRDPSGNTIAAYQYGVSAADLLD